MEELIHTIQSHKFHYLEWGKKNHTTIICLHGLGNSASSFAEMAQLLLRDYRILSFDNPGHGKTFPFENEDDYLFSNLAKWYNNVFQQVVEKPFYILGHSLGADIALHYAKQYPDQIKGVILLDGGYTFPDFQDDMTLSKVYDGWEHYMNHSSVFDTWINVKQEYQQYTQRWNKKIENIVSTFFNKQDKYELILSKFTVMSIMRAYFEESFTITYPYIKSPLILFHATLPEELTNSRNRGITLLKQNVKDVTVVSMNNTNHMVHWDDPVEVAGKILNWLDEL